MSSLQSESTRTLSAAVKAYGRIARANPAMPPHGDGFTLMPYLLQSQMRMANAGGSSLSILRNAFTPRHLEYLRDYAGEHGLKVAGPAMGTLVCSVREEEHEEDMTGFFEVWLPIEEK